MASGNVEAVMITFYDRDPCTVKCIEPVLSHTRDVPI